MEPGRVKTTSSIGNIMEMGKLDQKWEREFTSV